MYRLITLLLFAPLISICQSTIKVEKGTFDYVNGVRYRAIFEKDLNIESQNIKINAEVTFVGYPIREAYMKVEKKEGRTRITVTEFSIGKVSSGYGYNVGNMTFYHQPSDYEMENATWNYKRKVFKSSFVNNYAIKLEKSILQAIENLCNNVENDDW